MSDPDSVEPGATSSEVEDGEPDLDPAESAVEGEGTGTQVPLFIKHSGWGFAATLLAVLLGFITYQLVTWPDVAALATEIPQTTAFISRYEERLVAGEVAAPLRWTRVPYDSISIHARRAVVAGEDISFFSHDGFAMDEMWVAIGEALKGDRGLRGASTITQQVAKNLWLTPSRNPLRKIREAMLTRQLEEQLSKWRILEIYLNVAEFGPGIYGIEAASRHYFDKPAAELTENEAAQLAASLPRPGSWHPGVLSRSYQWYVKEIEERMERAAFLWRRVVR